LIHFYKRPNWSLRGEGKVEGLGLLLVL